MRKDQLLNPNTIIPVLGVGLLVACAAAAVDVRCRYFPGERGPDTALVGTPDPWSKLTSPADANGMIDDWYREWCQVDNTCQKRGFPTREVSGMNILFINFQTDFDYKNENGESVARQALVWVMDDNGDEDYGRYLFEGQKINWKTIREGREISLDNLFASLKVRAEFRDNNKLNLSFLELEDGEDVGSQPAVVGEKEIDWTPQYGMFILTEEGEETNGIFLRVNDGQIETGTVVNSE